MKTASINIELSDNMNSILETMAEELHTTKTELITDTIMNYIKNHFDNKTIEKDDTE